MLYGLKKMLLAEAKRVVKKLKTKDNEEYWDGWIDGVEWCYDLIVEKGQDSEP